MARGDRRGVFEISCFEEVATTLARIHRLEDMAEEDKFRFEELDQDIRSGDVIRKGDGNEASRSKLTGESR